ncbi:hypothetical protein D3C84_976640 [compost metagenome]
MIWHNDMGTITDHQILGVEAVLMNIINFLDQGFGIDHHSVTDYASFLFIKYTRWNQAQLEFLPVNQNRVTGIVTPLIPGDHICALCQKIRDLAFAFVSPLCSHDDYR